MTSKPAATPRRRKLPTPQPGFFDPRLRYRIPVAAQLLGCSVSKLYAQIACGAIQALRDGGNTFIAGAEIERRCQAPPPALSR
jgi:hypothetical protein